MSEKPWVFVEDLLMLYDIDPSTPAARDFCGLVELSADVLAFPELGCGTYSVAVTFMKQRKWSPLVYWARLKKVVQPLLVASDETLTALGISVGEKRTTYTLAHAIACSIAADNGGDYQTALEVVKMCRQGSGKHEGV